MKYVIIGNGVAGVEAALAIRETDASSSITILSRSSHPFYYRPRLIDFIKDNIEISKLYAYKDEFWEEKGVDVIAGIEVVKAHIHAKKVVCIDESEYAYDKLLIAVGADPNMPVIENSSFQGVFTLRGISSAERIREYCKGKKNIVIAGGGLLGIEIAHALSAYCENITVIDVASCLLPRQLDEKGAECLQNILETRGLRFLFRDCVKKIEGDSSSSLLEPSCIKKVILSSGLELPADVLIVSAGVHARTEFALNSGLKVNKGIVIDNEMRTTAGNIYSAGDCAEHNGICYGLWTIAKEQGRIAGLNMAGGKIEYNGSVPSTSLKVTGVDVFSSGDFSAAGDNAMMLQDAGKYARIIYNGDMPVGAVVVGDSSIVREARKAMAGKGSIDEMKKVMGTIHP
jgi:nitrite reductase (NADH) large subunit